MRDLHVLAQAAHRGDVARRLRTAVLHAVHDRAGAEEQTRLEEGVRADVEDRGGPVTGAGRDEHEAELTDRGVREDLLQIGLGERHEGGGQRGEQTHRRDHDHRRGRRRIQEAHPADHVDAGGHHRGRVDQGGDRCRSGHRVGQPDVQWKLRGLSARTDEQQDAGGGGEPLAAPEVVDVDLAEPDVAEVREVEAAAIAEHVAERLDHHRLVVGVDVLRPLHVGRCGLQRLHAGALGRVEQQEHAEEEGEVTDAIDDERLAAGGRVLVLLEPEADQQERAQADALPADEHDGHVRGEDEDQHRSHEQIQVAEVRRVARLVAHVARRVDVDQRADERDDQDHHRRQRIEPERERDLEVRDLDPGVDVLLERGAERIILPVLVEQRAEHQPQRQPAGGNHRRDRDRLDRAARQLAAEGQVDRRADQRQQRDPREDRETGELDVEVHTSASTW